MAKKGSEMIKKSVIGLSLALVTSYSAVISLVGDSNVSVITKQKVTGLTHFFKASDLGLQKGDDIDALSLGDDTKIFGDRRHDIFAVDNNSTGAEGDLYTRKQASLFIGNDLYVQSFTNGNQILKRNIVKGQIDGFDFGSLYDFQKKEVIKRALYFSLTPDSPTLKDLNATAGDILVVFPTEPTTLKVFVKSSEIGSPTNIDALSMHIENPSEYNSTTDYIIYKTDINSTFYHYGIGAGASGFVTPHTPSEFGLLDTDKITALEHGLIKNPCIKVQKGWNNFGLNEGVANVENYFNNSNIVSVWKYLDNGEWEFYSPNKELEEKALSYPNVKKLETIEGKKGFWILGKEETEICDTEK